MTSDNSVPLLVIGDLRIETTIEGRTRTLVSSVDLTVDRGEVVAIVGESGSGKSLTARAAVGLLPRGLKAAGRVKVNGRDVLAASEQDLQSMRGSEIALVLQDPFTTLNPLMKLRDQIGPTKGPRRSKGERHEDAVRRLREVGINDEHVAERYPWELSGGMRQRVALAAAVANDPEVLIADEFSTALDVTTQKAIWLLLRQMQTARGMGLVLITHDLRMAFSMCDRVVVMYAGYLLETGDAVAIEQHPMHPYTQGLLLSEPEVSSTGRSPVLMPGRVPNADDVANVCAFAPRCSWASEVCSTERPELKVVGPDRATACVRIEEIDSEMSDLRARTLNSRVENTAIGSDETASALVVVRRLGKVFGTAGEAKRSVTALADVSLEIAPGESVGLVGESGAGKTTLARCLVGLETPTSGSIEIAGLDASRQKKMSAADARQLRHLIQYVFQDPYSSLNPTKTVGATLSEAIALRRGKAGLKTRMTELLEIVGLPAHYAPRKPVALSGGERQRVAIARALALEPRVIVCDEPVSALDVSVQAQILELLSEIRKQTGVSYLFITHDLAVVRQVADRVYVLYRGGVVEEGLVSTVLDNPGHEYTRTLLAAVPGQWHRDSGLTVPPRMVQ